MNGAGHSRKSIVITNPAVARFFIVLVGLVFLSSALFTGWLAYQQLVVYPEWRTQTAQVNSLRHGVRRGMILRTSYTYSVEGITYNGRSQIDRAQAINTVDGERTMQIKVNPNNPAESAVQRSAKGFILWTSLIIPFGAFLIYKGIRYGH